MKANVKTKEELINIEKQMEQLLTSVINIMDLPVNNAHIKDTPKRIAKMYIQELFSGCYQEPPKITTFPIEENNRTPISLSKIQIKSVCSHHFVPFIGTAAIEYYPKKEIVGISKLARISNYYSRRPQVQEELTSQIGQYLFDVLDPEYVCVVIKAKHLCIAHRGANEPFTEMTTSWYWDGTTHLNLNTVQRLTNMI